MRLNNACSSTRRVKNPIKFEPSFGEHLVKFDCLADRAREAIKNETRLRVGRFDASGNNAKDDIVWHKPAPLHDTLCLLAKFGSCVHRGAKHFASRELRNPKPLSDSHRLCALACSWRP